MYKINKVDEHYEVFDVDGHLYTETNLRGNSEAEIKGKLRMIIEDLGIYDIIKEEVIREAIDKLKNYDLL